MGTPARGPTLRTRSSGVLLHPTCLPGRHGSGDLGAEARSFVDFLASAGQMWWAMLPVAPPGYGESPYSAQSAFAGSPLLVSPERLAEDGWLSPAEVVPVQPLRAERVEYQPMEKHRMRLLRLAFDRWNARRPDERAYERFCADRALWLHDFALFRALKRRHGGAPWTEWPAGVRWRNPAALDEARRSLADEIAFEQFVQYAFEQQWGSLRDYAAARGIGLIGDIPIFVAHDSADVWQDPRAFYLDPAGNPTWVTGVPPDYFSSTGQRWGNPLYRWKRMRRSGYRWWCDRLRVTLRRFDAVRVDHFIGFQRYWRIPAAEPTAVRGRWMKGPGADFFVAMTAELGELPLIAEDLGAVTPSVFALRDRFGLPGIKILQFAFGSDPNAHTFLPHNFPRRAVVFTGSHDNDTTVGWFHDRGGGDSPRSPAQAQAERDATRRYLGVTGKEIEWDMIRAALASVARLAIVPLQDLLGLGSEARFNRPGTATGNWAWRFAYGIDPAVAERLATLTRTYGRAALRRRPGV
ncbi:MAG: 4-alpha-glucanotransferase [Polyangiaceae bacterium]|jgi:4-alpha-glucanotransferase